MRGYRLFLMTHHTQQTDLTFLSIATTITEADSSSTDTDPVSMNRPRECIKAVTPSLAKENPVMPFVAIKRPTFAAASVATAMPPKKSFTPAITLGSGLDYITPWTPIYFKGEYKDSELVKHAVLTVLLPSGVGAKDFSMSLVNDNTELAITVHVPEFITEPKLEKLHSYFKKLEGLGKYTIDNKLLFIRQHAVVQAVGLQRNSDEEPIFRRALIALDMEVEPNIDPSSWHLIGYKDGTRIIYLDLKAPSKKHTAQESKDFVVLDEIEEIDDEEE